MRPSQGNVVKIGRDISFLRGRNRTNHSRLSPRGRLSLVPGRYCANHEILLEFSTDAFVLVMGVSAIRIYTDPQCHLGWSYMRRVRVLNFSKKALFGPRGSGQLKSTKLYLEPYIVQHRGGLSYHELPKGPTKYRDITSRRTLAADTRHPEAHQKRPRTDNSSLK